MVRIAIDSRAWNTDSRTLDIFWPKLVLVGQNVQTKINILKRWFYNDDTVLKVSEGRGQAFTNL